MNILRENPSLEASPSLPKERRKAEYLYIEAEEDHVANQDPEGSRWQPRLVYVHEGVKGRTDVVYVTTSKRSWRWESSNCRV